MAQFTNNTEHLQENPLEVSEISSNANDKLQEAAKPIPKNKIGFDTDHSIDEIIQSILLDPYEDIPPPQFILHLDSGGEVSPICSLGNISVIQGKAKSRKTFLISLLAAAALGGKKLFNKVQPSFDIDSADHCLRLINDDRH